MPAVFLFKGAGVFNVQVRSYINHVKKKWYGDSREVSYDYFLYFDFPVCGISGTDENE